MDEILAGMNGTITDVELVSDDTRKAINDTYTSGVQEIKFFTYSIEVKIEGIFERNFVRKFREAKRNFTKIWHLIGRFNFLHLRLIIIPCVLPLSFSFRFHSKHQSMRALLQ